MLTKLVLVKRLKPGMRVLNKETGEIHEVKQVQGVQGRAPKGIKQSRVFFSDGSQKKMPANSGVRILASTERR